MHTWQGPEEAPPENGGEDEDEEGPINDDTDDKYEDKNHAAPQVCVGTGVVVHSNTQSKPTQGTHPRPPVVCVWGGGVPLGLTNCMRTLYLLNRLGWVSVLVVKVVLLCTCQAAEEELELPEDLNLDGGEQDEPQQPEQEQEGGGEEEAAGKEGKDQEQEQQAQEGKEEEAAGKEGEAEGEEGKEGQEQEQPGGEGGEGDEDMAEQQEDPEGPGGVGEVDPNQPQEAPEPEEQPPEPMAVDGQELAEEEAAGGEEQQGAAQQQAGPRGIASGAPTEAPEDAKGAAHGAPEEQKDKSQQQAGEAAGRQKQQQPQQPEQDPNAAPDTAPSAKQADAGLASEAAKGAPAPITGGDRDSAQQQPQRRGKQQQQEPNPLRNLGDALEKWRANLAVQHEAATQPQAEDEAGLGGEQDAEEEEENGGGGEPPAGAEFQFLGAEERSRAGDTQALASATDEQAAQQAPDMDQAALQQQRQDEAEAAAREAAEEGPTAMEEDAPAGGEEDGEGGEGDEDGASRAAVAAGQMPRTWGGKQKRPQLAAEGVKGGEAEGGKDGEGKDGEGEAEGEKRPGMDELFGTEAEREQGGDADAEAEPSRVVAKLANASLKDDIEDRDAAAKAAAEAARDLEKPGPKGLTPEQVEALRAQLDERLKAGAAAAGAAGGGLEAADLAYGSEVWARCEALVGGLAGELTEQLRLILEPTLASKLAGDYRTGKRINMKKVGARVAVCVCVCVRAVCVAACLCACVAPAACPFSLLLACVSYSICLALTPRLLPRLLAPPCLMFRKMVYRLPLP